MALADLTKRLLALAETVHGWLGALSDLEGTRRDRVAAYALAVADTLARAAEALSDVQACPGNQGARRRAMRELGRIAGYIETIAAALSYDLDGRKLAGVKRRLLALRPAARSDGPLPTLRADRRHIERLVIAEGYFRALADTLRA
ncbi:MAG: hypothetical protein NW217_17145 [Hyphomicrobiaceae bacterium]|nr:hypothetical protein [Hyphomicrobiaceae bacterium]